MLYSLETRFKQRVIPQENGCWKWTGGVRSRNGYGVFPYNGRQEYAHRLSWLIHKGSMPKLFVCHSCDNRLCVNPEHLFLGTCMDNLRDAASKGKMGRPRVISLQNRDEVRVVLREGKLSQREIAKVFGISQATVSEINRGLHE